MISNINRNCNGCGACSNLCPRHCITINKEGIAEVDKNNCINCGLCNKVCQLEHPVPRNSQHRIYAAAAKDNQIQKTTSSGGLATLISLFCLKKGCVLFTATSNEDCLPFIKRVDAALLEKVSKSKYCHSRTENTYKECKELLIKGLNVVYIALPCQIAGLLSYLQKDYDNLTTIDLLCHGAPSQDFFQKYLNYRNKKNNPVVEMQFRDKTVSKWGDYTCSIKYLNGKIKKIPGVCDPYYSHFINGSIFRECCYYCSYASIDRVSDISLGDFWGISKWNTSFKDCLGVSSVIVNSVKGYNLWKAINEYTIHVQATIEQLQEATHAVVSPVESDRRNNKLCQLNQLEYNMWALLYELKPINILRKLKRQLFK